MSTQRRLLKFIANRIPYLVILQIIKSGPIGFEIHSYSEHTYTCRYPIYSVFLCLHAGLDKSIFNDLHVCVFCLAFYTHNLHPIYDMAISFRFKVVFFLALNQNYSILASSIKRGNLKCINVLALRRTHKEARTTKDETHLSDTWLHKAR